MTLASGFGVVSRTLDDNTMNNLVATLNTYRGADLRPKRVLIDKVFYPEIQHLCFQFTIP
ncbi:MAG: hypothetical protein R2788_22985 [Saprospiraceae bacterium]